MKNDGARLPAISGHQDEVRKNPLERMTSKPIDLGLLELLGNNVLLLLLPAGLSPGTPHIARRVPCLRWVWKTVRKTSGHQEKQREKMKGLSIVIMVPCSGACRSALCLVYTQNKCLELARQNLMKETYNLLVFDFHNVSTL